MSELTDSQKNAARKDMYRSRQQAMMLQVTLAEGAQGKAEAIACAEELEAMRAETERVRAEKECLRAEKEQTLAELAKALERLRAAGLSTD
jgi:arginine/ornithine N-succinyltransferase beta subunit